MTTLEQQIATGMVGSIEQGIGKVIIAIADMIVQGITDWRFWFVMLCTWAIIHYLKGLWDFTIPKAKRHRVSEGSAIIVAFILSLWVFTDDPNKYYYAVAAGLLNPYIYKFAVGLIKKYRPEWVIWLRSKPHHVEQHFGHLFVVRDDGTKIRPISPVDVEEYENDK